MTVIQWDFTARKRLTTPAANDDATASSPAAAISKLKDRKSASSRTAARRPAATILPWPVNRPPALLDQDACYTDLRSAVLILYHFETVDPYPPYAAHIRRQLQLALTRQSIGVELSKVIDFEDLDLLQLTLAMAERFEATEW